MRLPDLTVPPIQANEGDFRPAPLHPQHPGLQLRHGVRLVLPAPAALHPRTVHLAHLRQPAHRVGEKITSQPRPRQVELQLVEKANQIGNLK